MQALCFDAPNAVPYLSLWRVTCARRRHHVFVLGVRRVGARCALDDMTERNGTLIVAEWSSESAVASASSSAHHVEGGTQARLAFYFMYSAGRV